MRQLPSVGVTAPSRDPSQGAGPTPTTALVAQPMQRPCRRACGGGRSAVYRQADNPSAAVEALREIPPEQMKAIVNKRAGVDPSTMQKASGLVSPDVPERCPGCDPWPAIGSTGVA
ncbi:hypothetical protein GCM10010232_59680 [Streptomyces amakusaensis]